MCVLFYLFLHLIKVIKLMWFYFYQQKIGYYFKKPEIDYAIANRINKLFMFVIARFPSDLKLWLSHIEFTKRLVNSIL